MAEARKTFQITTFKKIKQRKEERRYREGAGGREKEIKIKQFGKRRGSYVQEDI